MNENSEVEETEREEQQVVEESCTDEAKRKKRKKKRKKVEASKLPPSVEPKEPEDVDEIERTVREVNRLLGEPLAGCSSQSTNGVQWVEQKSKEDVLLVHHKHLNPYNELKKIFGSKTIQAEQKYVHRIYLT